MYVKNLKIQDFRGFRELAVDPKGHVVVMGEPGAGRSDLIEALGRVLDSDASRNRVSTELDFHNRDTSKPIQISLTLAELGADLEQRFVDHLELWDGTNERLLTEVEAPNSVDQADYEWVLRLEYRARWMPAEERCEEWVHYPKDSDPDADAFIHARRQDVEALGFRVLRWGGTRILDLGPHSDFREVIERVDGDDFSGALARYVQDVTNAAGQFAHSAQVKAALEEIVRPLRDLLDLKAQDLSQLFQFAPEGGSTSGLLRSLAPSLDLEDGAGRLPTWRRGSTTGSLFRIAEALSLLSQGDRIVAIDDLGDGLDAGSAAHLAMIIRRAAGQAWVTTRVAAVAEMFEPQEVARLGKGVDASRVIRQGAPPKTKGEAIAAKHWHRNLLPALTYRAVVVVEGPNDFAALHALALRLSKEQGSVLPATRGVSIINAGMGGSGGYANVLRLAQAARAIGLRAIGVVDGDVQPEAIGYLQTNHALADAVLRLPDKAAIEMAIVRDLDDDVLRQALRDIAVAAGLAEPKGLEQPVPHLLDTAIAFIKANALHAAFIEALPKESLPPLAVAVLERAVDIARRDDGGIIQL